MTNATITGSLNKSREESSIRVLLIEDNPGDARLIQEMLKDTGKIDMRVEHAGTLKEGLKYVGDPEKPLDAVLLDLGLPDSQGFATFERFQKESESFTTIILSGLNDVDLALHAVRQGAQDYLVKGQISGDVLLRAIRHAIERDETDRLLRESQERYQSLVDRMPDAIVVHREGEIVFVNPATVELLKAAGPEELIGKSILDNIHPDYKEIVAERIKSAHFKGQSQPILEEKYVRTDGKVIDVEVTGTPFTFEGQPATQVIIRDISERKQRERELQAVAAVSSKLRQADSLDTILPIVLDEALASIRAEEGMITLVQPGSGDHLIAMGRGARAMPVGKVIPSGKGLTSVVVETGKPYVKNNFREDPDPRTVRVSDIEPTQALAIVPIVAKNQVIGTLGIGKQSPFEESDIRVLSSICNIG
ncbi:MAG: PAS domain S-box protein, partial [Nitrospirales bacterium]